MFTYVSLHMRFCVLFFIHSFIKSMLCIQFEIKYQNETTVWFFFVR